MADEFSVKLRLPQKIQKDEIIEVRAKIKHPSRTGLQLIADAESPFERFVRAQPAVYVHKIEVFYDDQPVSVFEMNSGTSDDPLIGFKLRANREAPVRVVVTNHKQERVESSSQIQFNM